MAVLVRVSLRYLGHAAAILFLSTQFNLSKLKLEEDKSGPLYTKKMCLLLIKYNGNKTELPAARSHFSKLCHD